MSTLVIPFAISDFAWSGEPIPDINRGNLDALRAILASDRRPTIPDVIDRVHAYVARLGSPELFLHDGMIDDAALEMYRKAAENTDERGALICRIMLRMSGTQRGKIRRLMWENE